MESNEELFNTLNGLIDGWCERRALKPLRYILVGYPMPNMLTDGWQQLYESLRSVRAFCRDQLTEAEKEQLGKAILAVQNALDRG